jgi:glycyl-tRNA synthetase beta chain
MPLSVALDASGRPTAALRKALAKLGRESLADRWPDASDGSERLYEDADGKARALFLRSLAKGATLASGLQGALDDTIVQLPIPKVMTYQLDDGWSNVQFVRPVHRLIALHGAEVVPVHAFGLEAGRDTLGHRFEAGVEPIRLQHADHYAQQLEQQGATIAGFAHRRAEIVRQLRHAANQLGLRPIDDDALLDEVTALVERPNVLLCQFEPQFLEVPPECLILTMKANQKYFPLLDAAGRLTNRFLVVSNIHPDDPSAVIQGNERVVRPRLADAKFFFDQDRKKTLESRLPGSRQGGLSRQARHHGRARETRANDCQDDWPAARRRCARAAGRPRRRVGQGRLADRHGRRVPRAARRDGRLLRPARRREGSRGVRDRRSLQAALCRRRVAAQRGGHRGRVGR